MCTKLEFSVIGLISFKGLSAVYFVIIMLGLTKGIRSVYTTLILPSYVPLSKLPSATGLQMVANGVMLGICAPALGKLVTKVPYSYCNFSVCF